ncbi:MAG TPA: class I SAM-dependent methyltransferase [Gammaproteobacteria bacterium]
MDDDYRNYVDWKQWKSFGKLSSAQARYFARELSMLQPLRGKCILEIGFGNGGFLSFVRAQGAEVRGTEMIPELVLAARQAGFDVSDGSAMLQGKKHAGSFDAVVAFDVLEHMDKDELTGFFSAVHGLLKPDGVFLARFPNGDSPFGRRYQNGDLTHKTAIGSRLIEHLAAVSGFRVVTVRNPRTEFLDNPLVKLVQLLQRGLRNLVEMGFGYLYFNRRLPLDQNLLAHLVKRAAKPVTAADAVPGVGRGSRPRRGPRRAARA